MAAQLQEGCLPVLASPAAAYDASLPARKRNICPETTPEYPLPLSRASGFKVDVSKFAVWS